MPTLAIARDFLFRLLDKTFTQDEFENLCFEFGVELDDVTSEREMFLKEQQGPTGKGAVDKKKLEGMKDEVIYKIDTPANRYDLLSAEGMAIALRVFLGSLAVPVLRRLPAKHTMTVKESVKGVRDFVVCAVLRDVTFTPESYQSFIDFQEKLHSGLARRRTLASVGTHDLDKVTPNFSYQAVPKEEITFSPLNQNGRVLHCAGNGLAEFYALDRNVSKFVPLLANFDKYPTITDASGTILSLPPIINSDFSKISADTKNIFIECTAPDHHKAHVLVNQIVSAFSLYCKNPFEVEGVDVVYEGAGMSVLGRVLQQETTPNVAPNEMVIDVATVNSRVGIDPSIDAPAIAKLLRRMMFDTSVVDANTVKVIIPASRSDVIGTCDIIEDVAIAYGYDNLKKVPCPTHSAGYQTPMNKLTHLLRTEVACAGYVEMLTFSMCSRDEAFKNLRRTDTDVAVHIANPQTFEFQVCRPSLLPGTLKTMHANKAQALPLKLFEISDVVVLDAAERTGCRNERRLCAMHCHSGGASFENVHGVVEYVMGKIGVPKHPLVGGPTASGSAAPAADDGKAYFYFSDKCEDGAFLPGRAMNVFYSAFSKSAGKRRDTLVGALGVLHPHVLKAYDYPFPASYCEINLEPLL